MKTDWPAAGAPSPVRFGEPRTEAAAALSGTIAVPLHHEGALALGGADAAAFLQGQFSNDVRQVSAARGQLSSYSSPKGRLLAVLQVLARDDGFRVLLDAGVQPAVQKRLQMHVLRSKVTVAAAPEGAFGLAGPAAAAALDQLGLPAPAEVHGIAAAGDAYVLRRPGARARWSVHGPPARVQALWAALPGGVTAAGTAAWRLLDIEAGVPTVHPATQDRFVAQMCNLDELGAISFTKGCYTGQEVVARVHYLGAVKRRMRRIELDGEPPEPGTKLEAGEVVDSAPLPQGSAALVVGASS